MSEIQNAPRSGIRFPSTVEIAGLAAALVPFVCKFTSSSKKTVNGRVVEQSSTDFVAIVLGLVAIGIGLYIATTLLPQTDSSDRMKRLAVIAVILVVGAYQLAGRGLGLV